MILMCLNIQHVSALETKLCAHGQKEVKKTHIAMKKRNINACNIIAAPCSVRFRTIDSFLWLKNKTKHKFLETEILKTKTEKKLKRRQNMSRKESEKKQKKKTKITTKGQRKQKLKKRRKKTILNIYLLALLLLWQSRLVNM